jgi:hypothetical protein
VSVNRSPGILSSHRDHSGISHCIPAYNRSDIMSLEWKGSEETSRSRGPGRIWYQSCCFLVCAIPI